MTTADAMMLELPTASETEKRGGCSSPAICSAFRCIVADPPWDYPEGFATQSRSPGKWSGGAVERWSGGAARIVAC